MNFIQGNGRSLGCSGITTCQGNLWNQKETMKTSRELSGTSKRPKRVKHIKRVVLKTSVLMHFCKDNGKSLGCSGLVTYNGAHKFDSMGLNLGWLFLIYKCIFFDLAKPSI